MGRPSLYTDELAETICERLTKGEPLARICADEAMPGYSTVRRWEDENEKFRALSMRARKDGTHYIADDCLRIADDDDMKVDEKRVRIDTRLRLIGKWNSKSYGDKLDMTTGGEKLNWAAEAQAARKRADAADA